MKVKIGNKIFSSNDELIMINLTKGEKKLINKMYDQTILCCYPGEKYSDDAVKQLMEEFKEASEGVK